MGELLNIRTIEQILTETLPVSNKKAIEPYDKLFNDLKKFGLFRSEELYFLIEKHKDIILEIDKDKAGAMKNELLYMEFEIFKITLDRINRGVFYGHVGLVREALNFEFGEIWVEYNAGKSFATD